jgi:hypothetical protein
MGEGRFELPLDGEEMRMGVHRRRRKQGRRRKAECFLVPPAFICSSKNRIQDQGSRIQRIDFRVLPCASVADWILSAFIGVYRRLINA